MIVGGHTWCVVCLGGGGSCTEYDLFDNVSFGLLDLVHLSTYWQRTTLNTVSINVGGRELKMYNWFLGLETYSCKKLMAPDYWIDFGASAIGHACRGGAGEILRVLGAQTLGCI